MSDDSSFQDLLARLESDQQDAATEMFNRFAERLVKLARARLDDRIRNTTDPWLLSESNAA